MLGKAGWFVAQAASSISQLTRLFQVPEDIYKSHLENVRPYGPTNVDSARQNLAASFVNG